MCVQKKSTGILGGSFNPVHYGHRSIAQSFLDSEHISELWILLTPESPHKAGQEAVSYPLRLQMLESMFHNYSDIKVSNIEQQLDSPYYTVQTMKYLTDQFTDRSFFLCMGQDSLLNFDKWYQWEEILGYCDLLVAARPDYNTDQLPEKISRQTHYVDHRPIKISSSQIRERVKQGKDISELVSAEVAQTITQNSLYRK